MTRPGSTPGRQAAGDNFYLHSAQFSPTLYRYYIIFGHTAKGVWTRNGWVMSLFCVPGQGQGLRARFFININGKSIECTRKYPIKLGGGKSKKKKKKQNCLLTVDASVVVAGCYELAVRPCTEHETKINNVIVVNLLNAIATTSSSSS